MTALTLETDYTVGPLALLLGIRVAIRVTFDPRIAAPACSYLRRVGALRRPPSNLEGGHCEDPINVIIVVGVSG